MIKKASEKAPQLVTAWLEEGGGVHDRQQEQVRQADEKHLRLLSTPRFHSFFISFLLKYITRGPLVIYINKRGQRVLKSTQSGPIARKKTSLDRVSSENYFEAFILFSIIHETCNI